MIDVTFTYQVATHTVLIEAWFCGARVADAVRVLPDYAPRSYFETPEVRATMLDIAQPVIDNLTRRFHGNPSPN
jgi:hypothetical protein